MEGLMIVILTHGCIREHPLEATLEVVALATGDDGTIATVRRIETESKKETGVHGDKAVVDLAVLLPDTGTDVEKSLSVLLDDPRRPRGPITVSQNPSRNRHHLERTNLAGISGLLPPPKMASTAQPPRTTIPRPLHTLLPPILPLSLPLHLPL